MKKSSSILAVIFAALFGSAGQASATTISFSFNNEDGPVAGTVSGTIELPDGDGTFAATSIIVDSAPAALGYTTPYDVLADFNNVGENTFTIAAGIVDAGTSHFAGFFSVGPTGRWLGINATLLLPGSSMNISDSLDADTGVIDSDNSTLVYSSAAVPEPATLVLMSVGFAGLWAARRKAQT